MQILLEIQKADAADLLNLEETYPEEIEHGDLRGIDGVDWLTFIVSMTETLAPHVFGFLMVLVANRKRIIIIKGGKRSELTSRELERLQKEVEGEEGAAET